MADEPNREELTDEQLRALGKVYDLLREIAAREHTRDEASQPATLEQPAPAQRAAWNRLWAILLQDSPDEELDTDG